MFLMVFRKMMNNKWMVACLLLGMILAVAMISSIPMYSEGILNRMLLKDMEKYQQTSHTYPGTYLYKMNLQTAFNAEDYLKTYSYYDKAIKTRSKDVGIDTVADAQTYTITTLKYKDAAAEDAAAYENAYTVGMSGLEDHITIVHGRMATPGLQNGEYYEAMISESAMVTSMFELDKEYTMTDSRGKLDRTYTVKIVGVYKQTDASEAYWYEGLASLNQGVTINFDTLRNDFVLTDIVPLYRCDWFYAFDYTQIKIHNLEHVLTSLNDQKTWLTGVSAGTAFIPAITTLQEYTTRQNQLSVTLTMLYVPLVFMLAFYIFMVAQLIIDNEKNEISVIASRGASRWQLFSIYLIQSVLLGAVAYFVGLALGYFIVKLLGAANGFLDFVSRVGLKIDMNITVYLYALGAVVFAMLVTLLPAIAYSKVNIVESKRSKARGKLPLWQKMGLDFIFLAIALYGRYTYDLRVATASAQVTTASVDPLLFLVSALFIAGAGLLFVRIYPYLIRLVFTIGKKFWSPVFYASFTHVGRSNGQEKFLMLFLVITMSLGIFSANAARTINTNAEDEINYTVGADLVATPIWNAYAASGTTSAGATGSGGTTDSTSGEDNAVYTYQEPAFEPYESLDGIKAAAKVYFNSTVTITPTGKKSVNVQLQAIDTYTFGQVCTMPSGLLPYHINEYLNLLGSYETACLITSDYAEQLGVAVGDTVSVTWGKQTPLSLTVFAIVDYWPAYNANGESIRSNMVICNLSYVRAKMATEPYQIWYAKEDGATSEQVYEAIAASKLKFSAIKDASQQIVAAKNDPMLQGTNGALTMSFIVVMTISAIGFIIYWILSIRSRVLQFGILRAMGMSMRHVIGMICTEQVLISFVSIITGVVIGGITAELYVPLLQIIYGSEEKVLPFRVMASGSDYLKIYGIVLVMLVVGFTILGVLISRIKIAQALKLGEE